MNHIVIIPTHNEEKFISLLLESIINQQVRPTKVIVVNDNSTDKSVDIINTYCKNYSFINLVNNISSNQHLPGEKVINAFNKGFLTIKEDFNLVTKLDADIILPPNYFKEVNHIFEINDRVGICGGVALIEKNKQWVLEKVANKEHVRGGLKSYRKECFYAIGKLKPSMGWDTVDELLALYNNWEVKVIHNLAAKHLKPTTANYSSINSKNQAIAFYKMDYGLLLSVLSILKAAYRKKSIYFIFGAIKGYLFALEKKQKIVNREEGKFIRAYRWKEIFKKIYL